MLFFSQDQTKAIDEILSSVATITAITGLTLDGLIEKFAAGWSLIPPDENILSLEDIETGAFCLDYKSIYKTLLSKYLEEKEKSSHLREKLEALQKDLNMVKSAVSDLDDFIDDELHPVIDYTLYQNLRDNVDSIAIFNHESLWGEDQE